MARKIKGTYIKRYKKNLAKQLRIKVNMLKNTKRKERGLKSDIKALRKAKKRV